MNGWINSKAFWSPPFFTALKRTRLQNLLMRLMANQIIKLEERWVRWELLSSPLVASIIAEAVSGLHALSMEPNPASLARLTLKNLSWDGEQPSFPTGGRVASISELPLVTWLFFNFKKFKYILFHMFLKTTFKCIKPHFFCILKNGFLKTPFVPYSTPSWHSFRWCLLFQ